MISTLFPSRLEGTLPAIPSKSYAHRLLLAAALAESPTQIFCSTTSEDIDATVSCLSSLGCEIFYRDGCFSLTPPVEYKNTTFDCAECGTLLRFYLPVLCALGTGGTLIGRGRLPSRPLSPLYEELIAHGALLSPQGLPMSVEGKLQSGSFTLAANVSSQFIGGLLMALPLLDGDSTLTLTGTVESRPYIDMTLDVLKLFQIQIVQSDDGRTFTVPGQQRYRSPGMATVEGDWSNAAFWLAAGALGHPVGLSTLDCHSRQGDRKILEVLEGFGAHCQWLGDTVTVTGGSLHGQDVDCAQIPDLVPILAVVAASASGTSRFYNAGRLRLKESDRIETVCTLLTALGGTVEETEDGLVVTGGPLTGGAVDSFNDHRIAMSAAIAALGCSSTVLLSGGQAVQKSYPHFYDDYRMLGGLFHKEDVT